MADLGFTEEGFGGGGGGGMDPQVGGRYGSPPPANLYKTGLRKVDLKRVYRLVLSKFLKYYTQ